MVNGVNLKGVPPVAPFGGRPYPFRMGGRCVSPERDGLAMMYRVIAIVCAGIALAACESNPEWMKTPDWAKMPDFKVEPATESVRLESEPPGAEAKASNGQSCRTPCALNLSSAGAATVTFTLGGYQPDSEKLDLVAMGDGTSQLRPNPLLVELTPLPPQPKSKKPAPKRKTSAKTAAKPAAARSTGSAAAPPMSAQPAPAPWPAAPQR
jgi:hypothetical protein